MAPLLLVLALAGVVGDGWGHDHGLGESHETEVFACQSGEHSRSTHVEAAHAVRVELCDVCLLRAQTRGGDLTLALSHLTVPQATAWRTATDPRIDSLGLAGPPGSRGPPSLTVVL